MKEINNCQHCGAYFQYYFTKDVGGGPGFVHDNRPICSNCGGLATKEQAAYFWKRDYTDKWDKGLPGKEKEAIPQQAIHNMYEHTGQDKAYKAWKDRGGIK